MPGGKGFVSKAQQAFAFATGKPWARRWAHEAGMSHKNPKKSKRVYARLPSHVKRHKKRRAPVRGRR